MKKIIFSLLLALALTISFPATTLAQEETTNKINQTEQVEYQTASDSVLIQEAEEKGQLEEIQLKLDKELKKLALEKTENKGYALIPIIAIIFGTLCPVLIIIAIFYFRNKNSNRKYALIEKAIESGQPLPEKLFIEVAEQSDTMNKGIKRTFVGIGLFIFLWLITGDIAIGSVGLLVMFIGLGEMIAAYYTKKKTAEEPPIKEDSPQKGTEPSSSFEDSNDEPAE